MAFDVKVSIIRSDYTPQIVSAIMQTTNTTLNTFYMKIDAEVKEKEYINNISSAEINKYIRVPKSILDQQKEEKDKLIKYSSGKYTDFEVFRNARYASISISQMKEFVVIWHNFSNKIVAIKPSFEDMEFRFGQMLSKSTSREVMIFKANTFSRQDDLFTMYHNGLERFSAAKKNALTDVKSNYGVDINDIMDNVDRNIAIHYAIDDYVTINTMIKELKEKIAAMETMIIEQGEMVGPDGTKLTTSFINEHKGLMARYLRDKEIVERTLKEDPIGCIKFFKMDALNIDIEQIEGGIRPG